MYCCGGRDPFLLAFHVGRFFHIVEREFALKQQQAKESRIRDKLVCCLRAVNAQIIRGGTDYLIAPRHVRRMLRLVIYVSPNELDLMACQVIDLINKKL